MTPSQRTKALISIVLSIVAIGLHAYLSNKFFDIHFGLEGEPSICNINSVLNCDAVTSSKFAAFLGIPIAVWGAVTNLIFLFLQFVSFLGWSEDPRRTQVQTFLLAGFVGVMSVVMGLISTLFLQHVCVFCFAAYLLSWVCLFCWYRIVTPLKKGEAIDSFLGIFSANRWVLGSLIGIPAMAFIVNSMLMDKFNGKEIQNLAIEKYNAWTAAPEQNFNLSGGLTYDVAPDVQKKMVIVEFADFLCPHCKLASKPLHTFVQTHPDTKLIFKTWPIDGTCNPAPGLNGQGDGVRCRLAMGTFCAEKLYKRGWEFHDHIFDQQETYHSVGTKAEVDHKLCESLNVTNCPEFTACLDSAETLHEIQAMAAEGTTGNLQGTPTVFVNGRMLNSGQFPPVLRQVYEMLH